MMRLCLALVLLTSVISSLCFGVSLTSHRIFLDKDQRTESFVIFNREQQSQNCHLSFQDFPFDKAGNMGKRITGTLPKSSASQLVRFSPRAFEIKGGSTQAVRFSLRRKANAKASEYQSYLSINCGNSIDENNQASLIRLSPRLVHNVPVVARTGKLKVQLSISDIKIDVNKKLVFKLNRAGDRSVYGVIEIIDKHSNKVVNFLQGVSLYVQSDYRQFDFSLPDGVSANNLSIRFTEEKKYGGNLIISRDVKI
mgnify:FL=1